MNLTLNVSSLLAVQLYECMRSLPSHTSAPLFKKVSMWHLHGSSKLLPGSPCTPFPQRAKKSFLVKAGCSLPVPLTVIGARTSLLDSPGWRCSYRHVFTVCVLLSFPDSVYPPKSLLIRVGGSLCRTGATCSGRGTATKLHFLYSVLSPAAGTSCRVFPLQLNKISYQTVQIFLCTP